MREMVEMAYEFEHDFVVDHSRYVARFGDHSTDLATAFEVTFGHEAEREAERGAA